jgi:hypothetical protein
MIRTHLIRLAQALVLVAAFAIPATALGGSNASTPSYDVFERYAAAHPFGHGILNMTPAPDVFERYAATHATPAVLTDGRSPDTRDAAEAARLQLEDRRSPDTRDAAEAARLQLAARSSSTTLGDSAAQPINTTAHGGFDWSDAGVGAITAALLIVLVGATMHLLTRSRPSLVVHPTRGEGLR